MEYLPIFINLRNKKCLVIGGGSVALRKINLLLKAQTKIDCIAMNFCDDLIALSETNDIDLVAKHFEPGDIRSYSVIISATNDESLNTLVSKIAHESGTPVNVVDSPDLSSFIMPSIVDRAPVVIAISSAGKAPVLARIIRAKLETIIPNAYGELAEIAGQYREKVKQRFNNIKDRRKFWEGVFSGVVAEKVFSGRSQEAVKELEKRLIETKEGGLGEVYLVGAGPGDPDLLTFKALRLIQQADVVLYDRLVSKGVLELVRRDAEMIYVGKKGGESSRQVEINKLMVDLANSGQRVCRLKGGDPFIFGRGGEEIETLSDNGISFQVVPGITAASGCSAYAGIPLTHRDYSQSCRFVTAHLKDGLNNLPWSEFVVEQQTVIFYMALTSANHVCQQLINHGMRKDMPVALVERGTTPEQKVYTTTLTEFSNLINDKEIHAPTLLIVGEVVNLREKLGWYGE
jgi:uroporphyrin-III C-methyltransferase/precorrin-2 dehydrogenase/sirohydrochlorin ferrochelatase